MKTSTWYLSLASGILGLVLVASGATAAWPLFFLGCVGLSLLLLSAAQRARQKPSPAPALLLGAAATGILLLGWIDLIPAGFRVRHALIAAGAATQIVLAAAGLDPRRNRASRILALLAHVSCAFGLVLAWLDRPRWDQAALPAYAAGLVVLILQAHWSLRRRDAARHAAGWDVLLLLSLALVLLGVTLHALWPHWRLDGPSWSALGAGAYPAGIFALIGFALAADPPRAPFLVRRELGPVGRLVLESGLLVLLVNVEYLAIGLYSPETALGILVAVTVWQLAAVWREYRSVISARRFHRRRRRTTVPSPAPIPLTVVIAARNEASILPRSVQALLDLPYPLRFLLVASQASTDGTVEVAQQIAAEHPRRVRALMGASGSKAGDLNHAWRHLDTDLALILDANETLDLEALQWGLSALSEAPEVGIVQGRKVSRDPYRDAFVRFLNLERRHSTYVDQPVQAAAYDTAHFAGSGALVRRDVPLSVQGWREDTLTEDIDLTLRLRLHTSWRVSYEPRMLIRESDPDTFAGLVRQRVRWSRGWAQCFLLYAHQFAASPRLPLRTRFGHLVLLLSTISALWSTFAIALLLFRLAQVQTFPVLMAAVAAGVILPSRLIGYAWAAWTDPVAPARRRPVDLLEVIPYTYTWVWLGFLMQLNALYMEIVETPRRWEATRAEPAARGSRPAPRSAGLAERIRRARRAEAEIRRLEGHMDTADEPGEVGMQHLLEPGPEPARRPEEEPPGARVRQRKRRPDP